MLSKQEFVTQVKELLNIQEELKNKGENLKYDDELYAIKFQKIENATKIMKIMNNNFIQLFKIDDKICSAPKLASIVYMKAHEILDDISYVSPKSPNDIKKIYELTTILKQVIKTFKLYHAYSPRDKRDNKFYSKNYIEDPELPDAKEEKDEDYDPEEYKPNKINKPSKKDETLLYPDGFTAEGILDGDVWYEKPTEEEPTFGWWFENSKKEFNKDGKLIVRKKDPNELRIVERTMHKVAMPDGTIVKRIHYKFD